MNDLNEKLAEFAELCFHEWEVVDDTTAFPYSRCRKCLHCGLKFSTDTDEWELPDCADGDIYFDESLDACFKWLVPKALEEFGEDALLELLTEWAQSLILTYPIEQAPKILCLAIAKLMEGSCKSV